MQWFLVILLNFAVDVLASTVDVGNLEKKISVSKEFEVIAEPQPGIRLDAVQRLSDWQRLPTDSRSFKFGITDQAYWTRATIRNAAPSGQSFYLVSEDPRTDRRP